MLLYCVIYNSLCVGGCGLVCVCGCCGLCGGLGVWSVGLWWSVLYSLMWSYLYMVDILTGVVFGLWCGGGVWGLCFSLCGGVCGGCGLSFSVSLCGYGLKVLISFFSCGGRCCIHC